MIVKVRPYTIYILSFLAYRIKCIQISFGLKIEEKLFKTISDKINFLINKKTVLVKIQKKVK